MVFFSVFLLHSGHTSKLQFFHCFFHCFTRALRDNGPTSEPQFYLASFYPLPILSTVSPRVLINFPSEMVAPDKLESRFYLSFWRSNFISCERVARDDLQNRNFTPVFGARTSFRAKGLRFVPSRWHCPCPRLQKRNRKEGEGKRRRCEDVRARGQEGKRRRCEDVRMWRCEDEKMWRC